MQMDRPRSCGLRALKDQIPHIRRHISNAGLNTIRYNKSLYFEKHKTQYYKLCQDDAVIHVISRVFKLAHS